MRFCYIARGSLEETFSHLALAYQLEYLSDETYKSLSAEIQELRRMLNGYIDFLKTSKRGASEPGASLAVHEEPGLYSENFSESELPDSLLPNPLLPDP